MEKQWYQQSCQEVLATLGSDAQQGLTGDEAARRLLANGPNELQEKARASLLERIIGQFKDFLVLILIAAAIVSAFIGEVTDSLVIVAIAAYDLPLVIIVITYVPRG